jgi:hypothetical protein
MAADDARARSNPRHHFVLVPGFVGFDALGQLDYYAGVTQVFDAWIGLRHGTAGYWPGRVSIHYFDNYPTASVKLRSTRLRQYLAKRIARGEFAPGDTLALVGHSTGGLDIRRALFDMASSERLELVTDGCCRVEHRDILRLIRRVVFLSVPQFGTNLADFACRFTSTIKAFAKDSADALGLNQGPFGSIRRRLFDVLATSRSNFVQAIRDALDESDESPFDGEQASAGEREARFELMAWLDNMANDFSIIEDLRSARTELTRGPIERKSPAHFSADERLRELGMWRKHAITSRSYATHMPARRRGEAALAPGLVAVLQTTSLPLELAAMLLPRSDWKWVLPPLGLASDAARAADLVVAMPLLLKALSIDPGLLFDVFHAACANPRGPFRDPEQTAPGGVAREFRRLGTAALNPRSEIALGDSDGVVNTLSMFWPYDPLDPESHVVELVEGDHGDVIGHFKLKKLEAPEPGPHPAQRVPRTGRRHYAYDFFQSDVAFQQATFDALWQSVFDYCVS